MTGKLIVIDGPDASGKSTQHQLLLARLEKEGIPYFKADFPQYGKKSCGGVEEYLNGNYGSAKDVGPYRASIFFAVDRYDASFEMRKQLEAGKIVITNRYVTANMAHQGGKIAAEKERHAYFTWVQDLEYKTFGIPQPDINIFLDCPAEFRALLMETRADKAYITDKRKDIHEADLEHLKAAEAVYLELVKILPNTYGVPCAKDGQLMSPEAIHEQIWAIVAQKIKK